MTNGFAGGMAVGTSSGVALGMMMAEEEKDKARRLGNIGKDQVLIKARRGIHKDIAGLFSNWYPKNGTIYRKNSDWFGWGRAIAFGIFIFVLITVYDFYYYGNTRYDSFQLNYLMVLLVSIISGCLCGLSRKFDTDDVVDGLSITGLDSGHVLVLIKKYYSDGTRRFDEDDVYSILNTINTHDKDAVVLG